MKLESAFCESNKTMTTINKSIWRGCIVMYSRLTCQVAAESLNAASPFSPRLMSGRILQVKEERSERVRVPELTRGIWLVWMCCKKVNADEDEGENCSCVRPRLWAFRNSSFGLWFGWSNRAFGWFAKRSHRPSTTRRWTIRSGRDKSSATRPSHPVICAKSSLSPPLRTCLTTTTRSRDDLRVLKGSRRTSTLSFHPNKYHQTLVTEVRTMSKC